MVLDFSDWKPILPGKSRILLINCRCSDKTMMKIKGHVRGILTIPG